MLYTLFCRKLFSQTVDIKSGPSNANFFRRVLCCDPVRRKQSNEISGLVLEHLLAAEENNIKSSSEEVEKNMMIMRYTSSGVFSISIEASCESQVVRIFSIEASIIFRGPLAVIPISTRSASSNISRDPSVTLLSTKKRTSEYLVYYNVHNGVVTLNYYSGVDKSFFRKKKLEPGLFLI